MATPFERVKVAWTSPNRQEELNHVVETMAEEGITRAELSAALDLMLREVRAAGADDATEEIILGVCDRLYGWCHPTYHITTRTSPDARGPDIPLTPPETA